MYDILQLISWLKDNPGVNVELKFVEDESLWLLRVNNPKYMSSSAYFKVSQGTLGHLIDILEGLKEDVQCSSMEL